MPTNFERAALEIEGTYTVSPATSYETLSLFDTLSHSDQVEVYRVNIETAYQTAYAVTLTLTRNEKTLFSLVDPEWITFDETTKTITEISIPASTYSFTRDNQTVIYYPPMVVGEAIEIRRKVVSVAPLTEFITGSRITADQLNLLSDQMIGLGQESKFELESKVVRLSDQNVEYATPEYVDTTLGTLLAAVTLSGTIDDGVNHDKELVFLTRPGVQNVPTAAGNLKWLTGGNILRLKGLASQTQNRLELTTDSEGTLVNFFNARGVLNSAGRIFYGATEPTPNGADTGLLWWDTSASGQTLKIWNGSSFVALTVGAGSYVATTGDQTIAGVKTFSNNIVSNAGMTLTNSDLSLVGTSVIKGSGANKTIVLQPTNGTSTAVTSLTVSQTAVTVAPTITLEATVLGPIITGQVGMLAAAQTFTNVNTFSDRLIVAASTAAPTEGTISSTTNTGTTAGVGMILRTNLNANSRYVRIFPENDATNGITINPKGSNGTPGLLLLDGKTTCNDHLTLANNKRIRNLKDSRIPGSFITFVKAASIVNQASIPTAAGLAAFPEATVAASVDPSGNVVIAINQTSGLTQTYRINIEQAANPTDTGAYTPFPGASIPVHTVNSGTAFSYTISTSTYASYLVAKHTKVIVTLLT